jgi:hypothetical protein
MAQVVEHLPNKSEALSSNSSTTENKEIKNCNFWVDTCIIWRKWKKLQMGFSTLNIIIT